MGAPGLRKAAISLFVSLLALSSCSPAPAPPERVVTQAVDPSFLHGTDGGRIDRLAATVVTDVQGYWAAQFPATFDAPWRGLDGGFFSVDTTRPEGRPPPCSADNREVEGNAYYCATVDAMAWDRTALLPVLREHYGEGAIVVVLAHEFGHAVQQRAGTEPATSGQPVLVESMADCYAGAFIRWVSDGRSQRLHIGAAQLDSALRAVIVFRDPVGATESAADAHGTAFDRVSAFQDGFRDGPRQCPRIADDARPSTEPGEHSRSLDEVVRSANMRAFFANLVPGWVPPRPNWATDPATRCSTDGSPVAYCSSPPAVVVDRHALASLHHDIGDQASATVLASRYAIAALAAKGQPVTGAAAGKRAACLTGVYTAAQNDGALSPSDLDAAVEVLLADNAVSRDASGSNTLTGFERIAAFRVGVTGGSAACGA